MAIFRNDVLNGIDRKIDQIQTTLGSLTGTASDLSIFNLFENIFPLCEWFDGEPVFYNQDEKDYRVASPDDTKRSVIFFYLDGPAQVIERNLHEASVNLVLWYNCREYDITKKTNLQRQLAQIIRQSLFKNTNHGSLQNPEIYYNKQEVFRDWEIPNAIQKQHNPFVALRIKFDVRYFEECTINFEATPGIPVNPNSLNFDGLNDYVTSDISTPFNQWDISQPWTFFISFKGASWLTSNRAFFSTKAASSGGITEIALQGASTSLLLLMRASGGDLRIDIPAANLPGNTETLQISYDGSTNASGISVYVDGVQVSYNITTDSLAGTLINGDNAFTVGRTIPAFFPTAGKMRWMSFVNYVKDISQIQSDHANRLQAVGTGAYLMALDFNQSAGLSFTSVGGQNLTMNVFGQLAPGDWIPFNI